MMETYPVADLERLELELLLDAVKTRYGYDFHDYARASMIRRVRKYMEQTGIHQVSELIPLFLHDHRAFYRFVKSLSVVVTEMFRDPDVFQVLREEVIPVLKTYPFIKIWHAGCASGQEVYSMAILLEEEGILDRCQIYATDFNDDALKLAKKGIYPAENIALYENNYRLSGGKNQLDDYWVNLYDAIKINSRLSDRVTFANHNLVTDGVFGEMHLVMCRNVLIYFNEQLQDRALTLINDSLCPRGFLCIGRRENLKFSPIRNHLEGVSNTLRIYRKIGS
ncbi:protein-glutamate O-methyltransferase CheR [Endozoicomonas sp. SCSIO W0465]|uniref:CheR family methyltransferase n=1 Tax=Endozoicomonas sp. SCSIO W0465 TaxID=2918516 RepID=UPI0020766359|nr:protein-glutamate O-methyltransferase CheR [Endozoicomonas sp. SCSIO W0465]USE37550.1 protein-glutamate O-methyltransferase CheR [Endozoicomonas sp. SCSIO W0465]